LAIPVTAPLFIAMQTQALQNQLIVNAIEAVKPLQSLPDQIESKITNIDTNIDCCNIKIKYNN
jgi:hypothetical protein